MIKFKPGEILYTRVVDDACIVHFYQVIRATSNTCEIKELRKRIHSQNFDEQEVLPIPNEFIGPSIRRKVQKSGCIMVQPGHYAWPWDGATIWQTVIIYMP
jgi:hypothetical protein